MAGPDPQPVAVRRDQAGEAAVRDHDALRGSRRPRGVDDVGRVIRVRGVPGCRIRPGRHLLLGGQVVEDEHRTGVGDHERQPVLRVGRVHREERRSRLDHRDGRHHRFPGPGEPQAHEVTPPHTALPQPSSHPVGPRVQLAVGQHSRPAARDRDGIGGPLDVNADQIGEHDGFHAQFGAVPLRQQSRPVPRTGQLHLADRDVRVGQDPCEQTTPPVDQGDDGGLVVQVGRVLHEPLDPRPASAVDTWSFGQRDEQVEPGGPGLRRLRRQPEPGETHIRRGGVLQHHRHLEQRVVGWGALRVQHLHDVFERHILVCERAQAPFPYPADQFAEGRVTGQVRAEHQRVDEEPDRVVQRHVRPAGDTTAQWDIGARARPGQQCGETRLHHHEQRRATPLRQRAQRPVVVNVELEVPAGSSERGGGRTRPVGGQGGEIRQIRQFGTPVVDLLRVEAVRVPRVPQQLPLPERVVHVLHRQWRPGRGATGTTRRVGVGQVLGHRRHRPAVTRDVVDYQDQYVFVLGQPEQRRAHRRLGGQVDAPLRFP